MSNTKLAPAIAATLALSFGTAAHANDDNNIQVATANTPNTQNVTLYSSAREAAKEWQSDGGLAVPVTLGVERRFSNEYIMDRISGILQNGGVNRENIRFFFEQGEAKYTTLGFYHPDVSDGPYQLGESIEPAERNARLYVLIQNNPVLNSTSSLTRNPGLE